MELINTITRLREVALSISKDIPNLKWYLFGSILDDKKHSNDVDLLIVYTKNDEPKKVKNALYELHLYLPLDLVFMNQVEENELSFLTNQKNIMIFPRLSVY